MQYLTHNGKFIQRKNEYCFYEVPVPIASYDLSFKLSVIRNQEMDNAIGNALSTNLNVDSITGGAGAWVLNIGNLPAYSEFNDPSSWVVVATTTGLLEYPVFCTSINTIAKNVIIADSSTRFPVGTKVALYNPFLNYEFMGNQLIKGSIKYTDLNGWGGTYTGGSGMFKDGSTYKWLFYGYQTGVNNQIGLAASLDMINWTIQNNGGPWITKAQLGANCLSVYAAGDIGQIDSSYFTTLQYVNSDTGKAESRILFFDKDVSNLSMTGMIKDNSLPGGIVQIGSEWHMLYEDISTSLPYRNIKAAKSTAGIGGPYTDYQMIVYAADPVHSPAGVCWDLSTEQPTIHKINGKVFGLFGTETYDYKAGVGYGDRAHALLDFDENTQVWSINSKGPIFIAPMNWQNVPGSPGYTWAGGHDGQGQCMLVDGSTIYMGNAFLYTTSTYQAPMMKLKNVNLV